MPEDVARVARSRQEGGTGRAAWGVALSEGAIAAVERARAVVEGIVERGEVVYGITTGFGAFRDRVIPADQLAQLQVNLILSHCVGVGTDLPREVVRAMMLCRGHALSLGYSGIRLETLRLLYEMLNAGVHPRVPEQGSVGSSGDLAPLSHLGLGMIGRGEVEWRGEIVAAGDALRGAGLEPVTLGPKEGLAITNGTSLMSGLLSLGVVDAGMLCDTADVVGAMTLEALGATPAAFDERIHAARPHAGQVEVARNVRALTRESKLLFSTEDEVPTTDYRLPSEDGEPLSTRYSVVGTGEGTKEKVQDAYSLRCIPQVHGAARDTVRYVREVLVTELNSANDNPLIFRGSGVGGRGSGASSPPAPDTPAILSGGNFHGAPLSVAADFLGIGVCQLANISERRLARLLDVGASEGLLPPFLTEEGGLNSGFMMLQYTAAALASENKGLAHPASVDTIPTSAGWEDVNSMGPIAARHARGIVANTARILALEALAAAQALDLRTKYRVPSKNSESPGILYSVLGTEMGVGTRAAYEKVRAVVPYLERDEDLRPHIAAVERLVLGGELAGVLMEV